MRSGRGGCNTFESLLEEDLAGREEQKRREHEEASAQAAAAAAARTHRRKRSGNWEGSFAAAAAVAGELLDQRGIFVVRAGVEVPLDVGLIHNNGTRRLVNRVTGWVALW